MATANGYKMNVDAVQKIAADVGKAGETLQAVNTALQAAITILEASAFVGLVGTEAMAQFLEQIQPMVAKTAESFNEINRDMMGAVTRYRHNEDDVKSQFIPTA